jgi:hypothetical protein
MLNQRQAQPESSLIERWGLSMVTLLCLCVMMQMLGVPATLLNPTDSAHALGASVLEGFSVPPALPQLAPSHESVSVSNASSFMHASVMDSVPFRPPAH